MNTGKLTESYIKQFSARFMLGSENLKGQAYMTSNVDCYAMLGHALDRR